MPVLNTADLAGLLSQIGLYFLVFCRVSGFIMTFPLTREWLPWSARLLLAMAFSVTAMFQVETVPGCDTFSLTMVITAITELLTGVIFGMVLVIFFSVFAMAGHMAGLQMALGLAELNDPASGVSVTVIARIYQVTAQLLFVLMNGHLVVFAVLIESLRILPPGHFGETVARSSALLAMTGWMFGAGLLIAFPIIVSLLMVNLTFGFMARSAPQMNLLTLGFPLAILAGLTLLSLNIVQLPYTVERHTGYVLQVLGSLMGL
ncbi:flagellar biosynthetic protein FliR [Endozoicomonas sp.]|uniref:flagellar biosynthetic protein FliR n=1 Tax=Endozoicomonas sp. TaxID=1892382 RepID=UPI00383A18B6